MPLLSVNYVKALASKIIENMLLRKVLRSVLMKPRISVLTIAVRDLEESMKFYKEGLGLQTEGIIGTEFERGRGAVVLFNLRWMKLCSKPRRHERRSSNPLRILSGEATRDISRTLTATWEVGWNPQLTIEE